MAANIPGSSSPILKFMSKTPRKHTPLEVTDQVVNMMIDKNVSEWGEILGNVDVEQTYYKTFASQIVLVNFLIFPEWFVDYTITTAAKLFLEDENEVDFILNDYLPLLKESFTNVNISLSETFMLWRKFVTILMRFSAFLW